MAVETAKALLVFLGLAIFAAWVFINPFWGIAIFSFSAVICFIMAWAASDYSIAAQIFLFVAMALAGYYLRSEVYVQKRVAAVSTEEIQKNLNILREGLFSHRGVREALKKKINRFFKLRELMNVLSLKFEAVDIANATSEAAFEIIGKADSCYFYTVDTEKQALALAGAKYKKADDRIKNKTGDIFDHWTFKQRQALFIEDVRKDFRFDMDRGSETINNFKSLISTPLIIDEKVAGSIRLNSLRPNAFLADDLRLLDIIAGLASVSLDNSFLYTRTMELAIRDSLTGVYVHKFFKDRLAEEVARCLRGSYNASVLLLDIDFFKAYNDKYGHSAGDMVLKKVAAILTQFVHDSGDMVARYGGEEFALILANKTKSEAVDFAEGIRKAVEAETFLLRREETKVTISVGIATCQDDAKICQDLIKAADNALYKAKKAGRNCVAVK